MWNPRYKSYIGVLVIQISWRFVAVGVLVLCCFLTHSLVPIFLWSSIRFNTLRPRRNVRHFANDIFKCFFLNENVWISINIWPKFVPKGRIHNIPALVQIMARQRPGDKPLLEPMLVNLQTNMYVTGPQRLNDMHSDNHSLKSIRSSSLNMSLLFNHCHRFGCSSSPVPHTTAN